MTTKTVHFTIGENFGEFIYNLSHEKITEEYDLLGALKCIQDSLIGITKEQAIKVLTQEYILVADVNTQSLLVEAYNLTKHGIKFDYDEWCVGLFKTAEKAFIDLKAAKIWTRNNLAQLYRFGIEANINIQTLTTYVFSENKNDIVEKIKDNVIDTLENNDKIAQCTGTVLWGKTLIEKSTKVAALMYALVDNNLIVYKDLVKENADDILSLCFDLTKEFASISSGVFDTNEDRDLREYIESALEISKTLDKGIKPINILEHALFDAYWISPEGEAYGLNGHIANMLHYQMADAILNKTEINPGISDDDTEAYIKLESSGWAKMTGTWVLFDGNNNKFTKKQQEVIGTICRRQNFELSKNTRFGYWDKPTTGSQIKSMTLIQLQKHLTI